jgi:hypothetical protein
MTAMILPGTYIEVRAEGLIAPGQVTVGNVGVVGTAAKGPVGIPVLLSNYNDGISTFGSYDSFTDPNDPTKPRANSLTLVRALQLVFANGASTVYAIRVADNNAKASSYTVPAVTANKTAAVLTARTPGSWGDQLGVNVAAADADVPVFDEEHPGSDSALKHSPVVASARTRVVVQFDVGKTTQAFDVLYDQAPAKDGQVSIAKNNGQLTFKPALTANDKFTVTYLVDRAKAAKVTLQSGNTTETYTVFDGQGLVDAITDAPSNWVTAKAGDTPTDPPAATSPTGAFAAFAGGNDGAADAVYDSTAFEPLLDVDAHIIVAAGRADSQAGAVLDAHCQKASTDIIKRDRIAVVGSAAAGTDIAGYVDKLIGNTLASDRVVFVAPGFQAASAAAEDQAVNPITLPGTYTAAVIAGMLAALPPHVSLTNKTVSGVPDLEVRFNNAQLTELVQNRVTALEVNRGIRVLRGQTTDDGAFREITTRRIVDFAKYGVRAAAQPFIGLLNNDRVRAALRATINSFLQGMKDDEMLVNYTLDVSATRDEQIKGIVQVTMTLQPVFSINFIRVTMVLS